jgi:hypothetical protein
MPELFVSYKREDEARVARLVRALERQGVSVWWDHGVPGGEEWRASIESALAAATCVIVVWSQASIGPEGGFVRDEAARAKARGILVPVLLDAVSPPLGFGELQAIDLTRWRGGSRDPSFLDVVAAVRAKRDGTPIPPARAARTRLLRRAAATGAIASLAGWLGIALDLRLSERACSLPLGQPFISDTCGMLRLGGRPQRDERIAWETSDGSCRALEAHRRRFKDGAYYAVATGRLSTRQVWLEEHWVPVETVLPFFVGRDTALRSKDAAKTAAMHRATIEAGRLCRGYAAVEQNRLVSVTPEPDEWQCDRVNDGIVCSVKGRAVCALEENQPVERDSCG